MTAPAAASLLDAVRRSVDLDVGPETVLVRTALSTNLEPAPARVWPLLATAAGLAQWYGPVQGDLREGGTFQAPGGAQGRILQAAEPHLLELTWDTPGASDPLTLRLDPSDDGSTQLELVHAGRMPRAVFDAYGPGATAVGWDIALLGLAAASGGWRGAGDPTPAPTPLWLASPQGAELVRGWSIRWAAASVAAGTDADIARAGELATTAAYGGAAAQPA